MVTLKKFKYIILSLLALAVIASATAFSVSYAKWASPETDRVDANLSTGVWDNPPSTDYTCQFDYGYIIFENGKHVKHVQITNYDDSDKNYITFELTIESECDFLLFIGDKSTSVKISPKSSDLVSFKEETGLYHAKAGVIQGYISDGSISFYKK